MEAITAARLSKVAEKAKLLPEIQTEFRKGRSTESALFLLTSQVEKVWKEGIVVFLLSLDISGVYNRVLPEILQKILKRKEISLWLTSWIFFFCARCTTTLVFDDSESSSIPIHCGVSQDFSLSSIPIHCGVSQDSPLFSIFFYSIFLNFIRLYILLLPVFLLWDLQMIQICLHLDTLLKVIF